MTGAVTNRCLSDMAQIDREVPNSLSSMGTQALTMATQVALVLFLVPWTALALPPLLLAYSRIYHTMRFAARDARRIAARMHTPVFAHFSDALRGRECIAAYGAEERFCEQNLRHTDDMSRASLAVEAIMKWAQALSTQSGCALYAVCGGACVMLEASGQLTTAELGLVLLYAASLQRAVMAFLSARHRATPARVTRPRATRVHAVNAGRHARHRSRKPRERVQA